MKMEDIYLSKRASGTLNGAAQGVAVNQCIVM
jgi:hypothetical protein